MPWHGTIVYTVVYSRRLPVAATLSVASRAVCGAVCCAVVQVIPGWRFSAGETWAWCSPTSLRQGPLERGLTAYLISLSVCQSGLPMGLDSTNRSVVNEPLCQQSIVCCGDFRDPGSTRVASQRAIPGSRNALLVIVSLCFVVTLSALTVTILRSVIQFIGQHRRRMGVGVGASGRATFCATTVQVFW